MSAALPPRTFPKGAYIKGFCNLFEEFLTDIAQAYPDIPNFGFFLSSVKMMRFMGQDNLLVNTFMEYIAPYAKQIQERDESFFMKKSFIEFADDAEATGGRDPTFVVNEINRIKDLWTQQADEKTKDCIHTYFVKLLALGQKAIQADP